MALTFDLDSNFNLKNAYFISQIIRFLLKINFLKKFKASIQYNYEGYTKQRSWTFEKEIKEKHCVTNHNTKFFTINAPKNRKNRY